jgi:hypothetical protein
MDSEELLLRLDEALTMEEIPVLVKLYELERLAGLLDLDPSTSELLKSGLYRLRKDSVSHSKTFSELIGYVLKRGGDGR